VKAFVACSSAEPITESDATNFDHFWKRAENRICRPQIEARVHFNAVVIIFASATMLALGSLKMRPLGELSPKMPIDTT
jgi:hypothetical protein